MQLSEPMPSYSHVPKAGDTRLAEPMPRSLHVPKGATCNSPNQCPATHMSPKQVTHDLPNRCPDHYTFPRGRHATLRTDATHHDLPKLSLHVPKQVTHDLPNRCPDHYTFPSGRHATFRTDAQITTRSQAGDMQLSEPMPRLLHVPKRATCNFPNRCPATHMSPSG